MLFYESLKSTRVMFIGKRSENVINYQFKVYISTNKSDKLEKSKFYSFYFDIPVYIENFNK